MWMIIDARMPREAITRLETLGEVMPLSTRDITYPSISGHPDIFFCQTPDGIIAAPNAPAHIIRKLEESACLLQGEKPAGSQYPASCIYNAFVNASHMVHKLDYTDKTIMDTAANKKLLDVKQGYSRCNLVEAGGLYITSDKGIQDTLEAFGLETMFVNPRQIILPYQSHGFIGGCAASYKDLLLMTGSCSHFSEGVALRAALADRGVTIYELYEGPLWDGGSIIVVDQEEQ